MKNTLSSKTVLQPQERNKDLPWQGQAKAVHVYQTALERILKGIVHMEQNEKQSQIWETRKKNKTQGE
jgi:hypothetical protein